MRMVRSLPVPLLLLSAACQPAVEPLPDIGPATLVGLDTPETFETVAAQREVPRELLLALAWHQTSFDPPPADEIEGGAVAFGWLAMTEAQVDDAAALSGLDPAQIRDDVQANLWAGAMLLRELAVPGADPTRPGADWWPAITGWVDYDEAWMRDEFALDVFGTIEDGLDVETPTGERIQFDGVDMPDLEDIDVADGPYEEEGEFAGSSVPGYPGRARYYPAYSGNYGGYRSSIRRVVIHTTEGTYSGAIGWFRNPSANVSAHYVLRRSDGQITQMVPDNKMAWHACGNNTDTIGIEHEGRASVRSTWNARNVDASARLTGWLAARYNIPVDRNHIVGHGEIQPSGCAYRSDPGPYFPWTEYMKKVRYYKANGGSGTAPASHPKAKIDIRLPSNGMQVGNPFIMRVDSRRAHHLSIYVGARRVARNLRDNPQDRVIRPSSNGWKRVQVRAYARDGVEVGRKSIRVRVRASTVDVTPHNHKIHELDYRLTTTAAGGSPSYVRYWSAQWPLRDKLSNRLRARPDSYPLIRTWASEGRKLLIARAYREDGVLVGEGWRYTRANRKAGESARIELHGADELIGQTMLLHAEATEAVDHVTYAIDGARVADADTGDNAAFPDDFEMLVDFADGGAHELTTRAYDEAGNLRHTRRRTVHAPSFTLEVGWERTGSRRYRFDADAPAGTERVLFYRGSTLLLDVETGQGHAPGRAFEFETVFSSTGATSLSAVARDELGNVLGSLTFSVPVE